MSDMPVSIILRSFNEGWALCKTLPALQAQEYKNWELIVIDSGSSDGSVDLIRQAAPRHFLQILPHEYRPSRVLNTGMQLARSEAVIFLNADATPQDSQWLEPLVAALRDPQTAAVFSRQIPRPDCHAVFASDYDRCFGASRESAGWDHFFSMVSSGIRRDIWAQRGFLESMQYSEDDEYTRWCRSQGHRIVYCPESVVMHSHNYAPRQAYKRSFGEAWALCAMGAAHAPGFTWPKALALGWLNDVRRDLGFCIRTRRLPEWPQGWRIRWAQRRGKLDGFKAGTAMHPGKALP
ncbi:MAG TPA: glycosyltransferase [Opitutaceae bacterium]|jgi:rhamnosyltransferase|nr:glycosyltransferase [Opitutaceae bacterium]